MSATPPRATERSFYASALGEAERADFDEARRIDGLDEEVALLRLRLREALAAQPEDFKLLQNGVRLLVQALLARHRLSPKQADKPGRGRCQPAPGVRRGAAVVRRGAQR